MAEKTLGAMIKEARTAAGFTQAKLAEEVGLSANDISKAERDLAVPSNESLKKIAKATGVTQKSLLDAAKGAAGAGAAAASGKTSGSSSSGKTSGSSSSGKTSGSSSSGKTSGSSSSGKTSGKTSGSTSSGKTSSAKTYPIEVTATEKKLVELYRAADSATKKSALAVLKGTATTTDDAIADFLQNVTSAGSSEGAFTNLLGNAFSMFSGGTREMPEGAGNDEEVTGVEDGEIRLTREMPEGAGDEEDAASMEDGEIRLTIKEGDDAPDGGANEN